MLKIHKCRKQLQDVLCAECVSLFSANRIAEGFKWCLSLNCQR